MASDQKTAPQPEPLWRLLPQLARASLHEGIFVIDRLGIKRQSLQVAPPSSLTKQATSDPDLMVQLHQVLGAEMPCLSCSQFQTQGWPAIFTPLTARTPKRGYELDADPNLALATWATTYHLKPAVAVETGVARGLTSATILGAMEENRSGHLYSIDLPPLTRGWAEQSRAAVPQALAYRWSYIRGSTQRKLPQLLRQLSSIDFFVHDSLHTYDNMRFELESAWDVLRPGGVLIADDMQGNRAFDELVLKNGRSNEHRWMLGSQASKPRSHWGLVVKGGG